MKTYHLLFRQNLPISPMVAWNFFSSPFNLTKITPTDMAFEITSDLSPDEKIYPGMIITYNVSPFLGINISWVTEITQAEEQSYFIDEQRFGPFKFWHHQHHFKKIDNGVEMTDILTYGLPFGVIGNVAHHFFIRTKLKDIFEFRRKKIQELFGSL